MKLKHEKLLSNFAFNCNLRPSNLASHGWVQCPEGWVIKDWRLDTNQNENAKINSFRVVCCEATAVGEVVKTQEGACLHDQSDGGMLTKLRPMCGANQAMRGWRLAKTDEERDPGLADRCAGEAEKSGSKFASREWYAAEWICVAMVMPSPPPYPPPAPLGGIADFDWTGRVQGKVYAALDNVDPALASIFPYLKIEVDFSTYDGDFKVVSANLTAALSYRKEAEEGSRAALEGKPAVSLLAVVGVFYPCRPGLPLIKGHFDIDISMDKLDIEDGKGVMTYYCGGGSAETSFTRTSDRVGDGSSTGEYAEISLVFTAKTVRVGGKTAEFAEANIVMWKPRRGAGGADEEAAWEFKGYFQVQLSNVGPVADATLLFLFNTFTGAFEVGFRTTLVLGDSLRLEISGYTSGGGVCDAAGTYLRANLTYASSPSASDAGNTKMRLSGAGEGAQYCVNPEDPEELRYSMMLAIEAAVVDGVTASGGARIVAKGYGVSASAIEDLKWVFRLDANVAVASSERFVLDATLQTNFSSGIDEATGAQVVKLGSLKVGQCRLTPGFRS